VATADVDDASGDSHLARAQQLGRARWGERTGLGVVERLAIGPHAPSGFRDLFDGAAPT